MVVFQLGINDSCSKVSGKPLTGDVHFNMWWGGENSKPTYRDSDVAVDSVMCASPLSDNSSLSSFFGTFMNTKATIILPEMIVSTT